MLAGIELYYYFMKIVFFYSLVRIQIKFDTMKDHWLFLGILYSLGIAFLSYVFIFGWRQDIPWGKREKLIAATIGVSPWVAWVGETFLLATLYFKLMAKFDEGVIFWTLLLLGLFVVWF